MGTLDVTSAAGEADGKTAITVSPSILVSGNSYKYKLSDSDITLPTLDQKLTTGWTAWNGTDEITATTGQYIAIAEIDTGNKCKKTGKATVVSNDEE